MSRPIIIASNLGKHYILGAQKRSGVRSSARMTLGEMSSRVINSGMEMLKRNKPRIDRRDSSFWALRER